MDGKCVACLQNFRGSPGETARESKGSKYSVAVLLRGDQPSHSACSTNTADCLEPSSNVAHSQRFGRRHCSISMFLSSYVCSVSLEICHVSARCLKLYIDL